MSGTGLIEIGGHDGRVLPAFPVVFLRLRSRAYRYCLEGMIVEKGFLALGMFHPSSPA
jgi:hypothetical protein